MLQEVGIEQLRKINLVVSELKNFSVIILNKGTKRDLSGILIQLFTESLLCSGR